MRKTIGRITLLLGLVAILIAVGTFGFHVIEGWSWFDAFYGTLMTISTIGAEPESQFSHPGRVFNVLLIFLGVALVGFAIGSFTHAVIQSELGTFFGRRRMQKEISKLHDHFIICGAGRVGRKVAMEIHARHLPLVIVEQEPKKADWAQEQGFLFIIGDATHEETLHQAGIERARGLASAVTSDAQNVYTILTARGMVPNLPIVARASEEAAESKLLRAGANIVISPYSYAGQRIARMLTRPNLQRFIDLALSSLSDGNLDLQIEEVRVAENSRLSGSSLHDVDLSRQLGIIILAVRRPDGQLEFNPGPDFTISPGDFLIAMGDSKKLRGLEGLAGV